MHDAAVMEIIKQYPTVIIGSLGGNDLRDFCGDELLTPYQVFLMIHCLREILQSVGIKVLVISIMKRWDKVHKCMCKDIPQVNDYLISHVGNSNYHKLSHFVNKSGHFRKNDINLSHEGVAA